MLFIPVRQLTNFNTGSQQILTQPANKPTNFSTDRQQLLNRHAISQEDQLQTQAVDKRANFKRQFENALTFNKGQQNATLKPVKFELR